MSWPARCRSSAPGPRTRCSWTSPTHSIARVFTARPGITGLAQLEFHDEARLLAGSDSERMYREVVLPAKLKIDAEYLDERTTILDLKILLRTVTTVLDRSPRKPSD